jgi:hypothetical protein
MTGIKEPPSYSQEWGFKNGAQDDVLEKRAPPDPMGRNAAGHRAGMAGAGLSVGAAIVLASLLL